MKFILFLPCTDVTILRKNLANALKYVNTALFTLLHSYMFQQIRDYPEEVLINFVSRVNKKRLQMTHLPLNPYFVDPAHEMYRYSLMMPPCGLQNVGVYQFE